MNAGSSAQGLSLHAWVFWPDIRVAADYFLFGKNEFPCRNYATKSTDIEHQVLRIGVSIGSVNEWSKDVSDEYQWRQLGSAVNAVLMQVKKKAIRRGCLSKTALTALAEAPLPTGLRQPLAHSGTADIGEPQLLAGPERLEEREPALSFGIKQTPKRKAARSSRIARL
jgi:hypothetical protein